MKRRIAFLTSAAAGALAAALTALPAQASPMVRDCHGPSVNALNKIAEQKGTNFAANVFNNVNTNSGQGPAFGDPGGNTGEGVLVKTNAVISSVQCNFFTNEDFPGDQSPQNPNLPPG